MLLYIEATKILSSQFTNVYIVKLTIKHSPFTYMTLNKLNDLKQIFKVTGYYINF